MLELVDEHSVLLRRDVVAAGYDDKALGRLVRCGVLLRLRQGAYVLVDSWAPASPSQRHVIASHAVMRQYEPDTVALSHGSAVQMYGGPDWGLDLSRVHLTSLYGTGGRVAAGVVHHQGLVDVHDLTRLEPGVWATSPARTVLDTASVAGLDAGLVSANWFLHGGLTTKEELGIQAGRMERWPNTLRLRRVVDLADGRIESVGETLCMQLFRREGVPVPHVQWEVRDDSGLLVARTDFAWPDRRAFGEFDGRGKYRRNRRPGETVEEVVMREKAREDRLRELTGWTMIRFVWADLHQPQLTAQRALRALRRTAA